MDKRGVPALGLLLLAGLAAACGGGSSEVSPLPTAALESPLATPGPAGIVPAREATCAASLKVMREVLGMDGKAVVAPFADYVSGQAGTGCQVTVTGTGADFWRVGPIAGALRTALQARGWTENANYTADSPVGTAAGLQKDGELCLVSVGWAPSADANCPQDQPISACNLRPEQQLYTITLNCATVSK